MRAPRFAVALIAAAVGLAAVAVPAPAEAGGRAGAVVWLSADDFRYGTYIIDQPGVYRLAEDVSFNPNSPATLSAAVEEGSIPADIVDQLGWPSPVDAYHAGMPLFTQFEHGDGGDFSPGGPMEARYDPAAYGIGFFAAIAIEADGVVLDLNGHTLSQSAEHALLQRFFSVIELADQPFVPSQGPASFGSTMESATDVVVKNGVIGMSSHHGIHGNGNENITIQNVDFDGYEVGAVALNGVKGLVVRDVEATNRKDVPVLGTFSSAMFIKAYIDELVRTGSTTTLTVGGEILSAADIQTELRGAINNVHRDIVAEPNVVDGRAQIDQARHPVEYGLFHNPHGLIDGNSYSFLVNQLGVAVNGFPSSPEDGGSEHIRFTNVAVIDQQAFINEVPAIDAGGAAAIDPVGAVFQVRNVHPDTRAPITVSSLEDDAAEYLGNPVADAQAFVAKAQARGDFGSSHLDVSRLNIPESVVNWVEGAPGSETLAAIGTTYLCNGDSMFHVDKGVIAFKMDSATNVRLVNTEVHGLVNLGIPGSGVCGDYSSALSHPAATLLGYGGSAVRAYTFAGSERVLVDRAQVSGLSAASGPAIGFAILTDSTRVRLVRARVVGVDAGWGDHMPAGGPNNDAYAAGFYVGADATRTVIVRGCAQDMAGYDGEYYVHDLGTDARVVAPCPANR